MKDENDDDYLEGIIEKEEEEQQEDLNGCLWSFFIAGVQHHQMNSVINDISVGNVLVLIPEPTNKFDPNAVRIIYARHDKEAMLGYVPKKFSAEVSASIFIGTLLECEVVEFNKQAKTWEMCRVEIREVE